MHWEKNLSEEFLLITKKVNLNTLSCWQAYFSLWLHLPNDRSSDLSFVYCLLRLTYQGWKNLDDHWIAAKRYVDNNSNSFLSRWLSQFLHPWFGSLKVNDCQTNNFLYGVILGQGIAYMKIYFELALLSFQHRIKCFSFEHLLFWLFSSILL